MMSPLSVASYIPPGAVEFDLVVFDEASQIQPVDAFGALLRGRQAVVVGDGKQLPPTPFFEKLVDDSEAEEGERSTTGDLESILGLFNSKGAPDRMLRWHYRSQHDSLIAVSNHEFYEDKLFVFPSPDLSKTELGVVLHYHPETTYEPGSKRQNIREAEIVADAVMAHASKRPHLSLGVAAFSSALRLRDLERLFPAWVDVHRTDRCGKVRSPVPDRSGSSHCSSVTTTSKPMKGLVG